MGAQCHKGTWFLQVKVTIRGSLITLDNSPVRIDSPAGKL